MIKQETIEHIKEIKNIYDFIIEMPKGYGLIDQYELIRQHMLMFDHGGRDVFYCPYHTTTVKLDELRAKYSTSQFVTAFSTVRKSLIRILKKYISELQVGVKEFYQE